ncbi:MAG: RecX family transcriptional regulator, partial [Lachnospiraceae bacterium]|nr:RecX family transcriptional regulator [Lachnospiraceae bacterium]
EKLREGLYPEEIEDEAITYMKSFHYIDDYRYACDYIFYHKELETKRIIEDKLRRKGIDASVVQQAFMDNYDEGEELQRELEQAYRLLEKKHFNNESMEWKEKQKIYAYLLRKGIRNSVIKRAMMMQYDIE